MQEKYGIFFGKFILYLVASVAAALVA